MRQYTDSFTAGVLAFPMNLSRRAFVVRALWVVNNTAAVLYLTNTGTPSQGAGQQIPAYTALPVYDWNSSDVQVGSDGTTPRDSDSLSLTYFDGPPPAMPSVNIAQQNYYDKPNPAYYGVGTGDGGLGTGFSVINTGYSGLTIATYTVPSNRKAIIDQVQLYMQHVIGATDNSWALAQLTLPGQTRQVLGLAVAQGVTNGAYGQLTLTAFGVLPAASVLRLSIDSATALGGTDRYAVNAKITEFDA